MMLTPDERHTLVGASARLTAILNLLADPAERAALDPARLDRDVHEALERFRATWDAASRRAPQPLSPQGD